MTDMTFSDDEASAIANALRSAASRYEEYARELIPAGIREQFAIQANEALRMADRFELECGV